MTAVILPFRVNRRLYLERLGKHVGNYALQADPSNYYLQKLLRDSQVNLQKLAESLKLDTDLVMAIRQGKATLPPFYEKAAQNFLQAHIAFEYMMAS